MTERNLEDYLHITLRTTESQGNRTMNVTHGVRPLPGETVTDLIRRTVGRGAMADVVELRVMRDFWIARSEDLPRAAENS